LNLTLSYLRFIFFKKFLATVLEGRPFYGEGDHFGGGPPGFYMFSRPKNVWEMGFLRGPDQALTGTGVRVEVRP
jgi:hypothetical protein